MKGLKIIFLIVSFLFTANAVLIDDFTVPFDVVVTPVKENQVISIQSATLPTGGFSLPDGSNARSGLNTSAVLGGSRDIYVKIVQSQSVNTVELVAGPSCRTCKPVLAFSVPAGVKAYAEVYWDGPDTTIFPPAYTGLGGVDLTAGGAHDAIRLTVGSTDLTAEIYIYVFSSDTAASAVVFNPKDIQRNLTGVASAIVLPYSDFQQVSGATGPADFTNVGMVQLVARAPDDVPLESSAIDLDIGLIETVPLIRVSKVDTVVDTVFTDAIAQPGERIRYEVIISNSADLANRDADGVVFFDDPATLSNFIRLVPGSVTAEIGGAAYSQTPRRADQPEAIVRHGNGAADQFVVVEIGQLYDGQSTRITFDVVLSTLPCCINACDYPELTGIVGVNPPCQVAGQQEFSGAETCKCVYNQATTCLNAIGNIPDIISTRTISPCVPSDDPATVVINPDATRTPIFDKPDPSISITRTSTGTVVGGSQVTFNIPYANVARRDSSTQRVSVTIPAGVTFSGNTSVWTCAGAICTANVGALAAGSSGSLQLTVTVSAPQTCDNSGFIITATIDRSPSATECNCADLTLANNNASVEVPVAGNTDLSVSKSYVGTGQLSGGSLAVFEITYANSGDRLATNAIITENLPANTAFVAGSSNAGWSCNGTVCRLNVGTILPGGSDTVNFAVRITDALLCNQANIVNSISIANDCQDVNLSNNVFSTTVPLVGTPDLAVLVTDNGVSANAGEQITYLIGYSNVGSREGTNAVLTATIPAQTTFNSAGSTPGFVLSGSTVTLNLGSLVVGASGSATLVVTVSDSLPCGSGPVGTTVTIRNDCGEFDDSDNTDSEETPLLGVPDLAITKEADASEISPGDLIRYTLSYSNNGNVDATGVVITERVPEGLSFDASASPDFSCTGSDCTASVGDLAAGASGTVVFAVRYPPNAACNPGDIVNSASIDNDCGESNPSDNEDTAVVSVTAIPDLAITKVSATNALVVGTAEATAIITISYINRGDSDATNTVITFVKPALTTINEAESSQGWDCTDADVCTYDVGTVAANDLSGGSVLIAVTVVETVDCDDVSTDCSVSITNDCGEANGQDNSDEGTLEIIATPVLTVTKTDNDEQFRQRGSVRYDITYENSGRRAITNAYLEDIVPENTVVDLGASDGWTCTGTAGPTTCRKDLGTISGLSSVGNTYIVLTIVEPIPRGLREVTNDVVFSGDVTVCGGTPSEDDEPTPVIGNPDLQISKTDLEVSVMPGDVLTYTITYSNIGERDATGVVITERVPSYTSFNAGQSSAGWSCGDGAAAGTVCTYSHSGSLGLNSPVTITFAVNVDESVACNVVGTTNEVSIKDDGNNGAELRDDNNKDTEDTPILGLPNLFVTIDDNVPDDETVRPGELIRYTITYGHVISGPLASVREATNVVVTTYVPLYTSFVRSESSAAFSCEDGAGPETECTLSIGSLKPTDATRTVSFVVRVVRPFPTGIDSTLAEVEITNSCGEADESDNFDDVPTPLEGNPDLIVQKHGRCASFQWDVTYSNIGDQVAREVVLTSHVPLDTVLNTELSTPGWECSGTDSGSECHYRIATVLPGTGNTVSMVTDTLPNSMLTEIVHESSIHDWRGEDQDPTPDNNVASAAISGSGCAECDSCCPEIEECCPDQTSVNFNFQGVLDGLNECS